MGVKHRSECKSLLRRLGCKGEPRRIPRHQGGDMLPARIVVPHFNFHIEIHFEVNAPESRTCEPVMRMGTRVLRGGGAPGGKDLDLGLGWR